MTCKLWLFEEAKSTTCTAEIFFQTSFSTLSILVLEAALMAFPRYALELFWRLEVGKCCLRSFSTVFRL